MRKLATAALLVTFLATPSFAAVRRDTPNDRSEVVKVIKKLLGKLGFHSSDDISIPHP